MGLKLNVTVVALLVLFASHANSQVFDITKNGAHPNSDSTQVRPNIIFQFSNYYTRL